MITVTTAQTREMLQQILDLQEKNLASRLTPAEAAEQGFVTVKHDLALLDLIRGPFRHVVVLEDGALVGYALVMLKEFRSAVPVLVPMFEQMNRLSVGGRRLSETRYFVMGQICVDKQHRGKGVFRVMYEELKRRMSNAFELVVTEVSTRNVRSLRAHFKIGFQRVAQFESPEGGSWEVISWDWRPPVLPSQP